MRAARKKNTFTQQAVASRLGISQGALSKMENGFLVPSAPQWFEFCEMTAISADSLTMGFIDRNTSATLEQRNVEVPFKVPRAYLDNRGSKVRAMLPFLSYFRSVMGEEKLGEYFRHLKLDPDYFVELDNQINLNFCLDISRELINQGFFKKDDCRRIAQSVTDPAAHGRLRRAYDSTHSAKHVISALLSNSKQYECNFHYDLEEHSGNQIVLSVKPEAHLTQFNYKNDSVLADFLCFYKKCYFESFSSYSGTGQATLNEVECHYRGADRCIYHLNLAG
jgi:transcriptional regulator with XRE-family HTH domain